ncbi:hypothetical protein [uncultured Vibrio sp.]|uniref:hypothetical protein n=1 Tax=uncultured Vibrio sp. TaxID=114054 RepID=UPI0025E21697|nr:hypothetical protein [uncultured Vibrio sp.]
MTKRSMIALLTIFLSLIMVQVSAASAFQESLHDIGVEIAHSQHTSEDHANGDCFNGELVNHLADELLMPVIYTLFPMWQPYGRSLSL